MNCKEAIRLMSEEMDRDLAGSDRFALRLHKLICVGCRNYHKQLTQLHLLVRIKPVGIASTR